MPAVTPDFRAVSLPREQYLRREEIRIRDAALPIRSSDPAVAIHANCILKLEELIEVFEAAEAAHRSKGREILADGNRQRAADAMQLKFYHLDQLAHLLI
jgi:hypothetical protein